MAEAGNDIDPGMARPGRYVGDGWFRVGTVMAKGLGWKSIGLRTLVQ
jgi:hypothetical protein